MVDNNSVPIYADDGTQIFRVFLDENANPVIDLKQSRSKSHQTLRWEYLNEQLTKLKTKSVVG